MRRDQALDHDLRRIEPVQPHAAREHELNGGKRDRQREEAGPVEANFRQLRVSAGSVRLMPIVAQMPIGTSM